MLGSDPEHWKHFDGWQLSAHSCMTPQNLQPIICLPFSEDVLCNTDWSLTHSVWH